MPWKPRDDLAEHFRRHGAEVGARTVAEYAQLADATIRNGVRFTFLRTGRLRIGYYHPRRRHFVVMDEQGRTLSLSRRSENYVRTLARSTYDG